MGMEKTDALVIRITDFSETSRVVTLFTREFGRVSALAKGGRRLRGPFDSALDLLATCRIVFLRKSSASLDLLTEAQLVRRFQPHGKDLGPYYGGYYVAELLQGLTEEYDPHPQLYVAAERTLQLLTESEHSARTLLRFQLVLLREIGQMPCVETCTECEQPIASGQSVAYWLFSGGLICANCHRDEPRGYAVQLGTLAVMQRLAEEEGWSQNRLQISQRQFREIQHVLTHTISRILGRKPKTLRYLPF